MGIILLAPEPIHSQCDVFHDGEARGGCVRGQLEAKLDTRNPPS